MFEAAKKAERGTNPSVNPILVMDTTKGMLSINLPTKEVEAALRPSAKGTETGFNVGTGTLNTADGKTFRMRFGWFALTEV